MPPINGQGQSRITPIKEAKFRALLQQHFAVVQKIHAKRGRQWYPYLYVDATAGQGVNPDVNCPGSPWIFLEEVRRSGLDYRAHFIERDRERAGALRDLFGSDPLTTIHDEDNREALPRIVDQVRGVPFGMLYLDPNGMPDYDLIEKTYRSPSMRAVDLLIRYNSMAEIRARTANDWDVMLPDRLERIGKSHWMVCRPESNDRWKWSFLFGLNTDRVKPYTTIGFHNFDSDEGARIAQTIGMTKAERRAHLPEQRRLFDYDEVPA
jgi:three-Cys-motif partner protein